MQKELTVNSPILLAKILGVFILSLCILKLCLIWGTYDVFSTGQLLAFGISTIAACSALTFSHKLVFTPFQVITETSCLSFRKQKQYTGIESLHLDVGLTEGNGPSRIYLELRVKPKFNVNQKKRDYSITTLFGIQKNELFKRWAINKNNKKIAEFNYLTKELLALYPSAKLILHERAPTLYKSITGTKIPWEHSIG
ncbi:hypothetical protein [Thalassotalea sediminis]|uniref:hypothetical protein n=1 Tax=Thalassotalea sediminis TaxID=1759089 RepID=UPI002573C99C|nr:hypothetical protein [Thalassotalea sediminis]